MRVCARTGVFFLFFRLKIADSSERGIYPPAFLHGVGDFFILNKFPAIVLPAFNKCLNLPVNIN